MGQNEVKIVLTTDASGMVTGIKTATGETLNFNKAVKETEEVAAQSASSVKGLTFNILEWSAGLITVSKAAGMVKESLNFLGQIETSTLGIASSYMASGQYIDQVSGKALTAQASLKAAQEDSKQTMAELQVANLQTIATLDQLVNAYQVTLPVAMSKGFNREQVKDFTVAMVQAAGAIGLPMNQLGEETRSLLLGTINPRDSRIATVLGLRNEDIRQHSQNADQLFTFLMGKLDAYKIAGVEAQNTWAGLMSNMKDINSQAGGMAFTPLFDAIKVEIKRITDGMITIDEKTKTIKWNPEFLEGINTFKTVLTASIAELYRMGMLLDKTGGTLTALGHGVSNAFLGPYAETTKGFEAQNKMFEGRYKKSDQALNDMAMMEQGLRKLTDAEKEFVNQTATLNKSKSLVIDQGDFGMYIKKDIPQKSTYNQTPKDNSDPEFIKELDKEILKAKREGYDKATALAIEYGQKMEAAKEQGAMSVKKVKEWYWAEAQGLDREQEEKGLTEHKKALEKQHNEEIEALAGHNKEIVSFYEKKGNEILATQKKAYGEWWSLAKEFQDDDEFLQKHGLEVTETIQNQRLQQIKEMLDKGNAVQQEMSKKAGGAYADLNATSNGAYWQEEAAFQIAALNEQYNAYSEFVQDKAALDEWYINRAQEIQEKLLLGESVAAQKRAMFSQAEANVKGVAYKAMENQMLKLIETGKFSVGEMAQVVAQQVKIELVGLAARAAVNALFYTGMGFAASASGNAASAALYYSAAAEMALVGGAALTGAALVNTLTGPGAQRPEAGQVGGTPINVNDTSSSSNGATATQERPRESRQIVINIHGNVVDHAAFVRELAPYIEEAKGDRISFGR